MADYQNFSEGALHLRISQSAVSHAIATLETDVMKKALHTPAVFAFLDALKNHQNSIAPKPRYL